MRTRPSCRMALPAICICLAIPLLTGCIDPTDKSAVAPQVETIADAARKLVGYQI